MTISCLRQPLDQGGHVLGILGVLHAEEGGAAGQAGAVLVTAGRARGDPVEGVADLGREVRHLPAARVVERQLRVDEVLGGGAVRGAGGADPDLGQVLAALGPADELLDELLGALLDRRGHAVLAPVGGAVGDVGAGDAVTRAVDGEGGRQLLALGDLGRCLDPLVPGGVLARHLDARLLEQRLVGEAADEGELGHEAGDDVRSVRPHPVELGAEVLAEVLRVLEVGRKVQPVPRQLLDVGDAGDVRTLSGLELDRQLLLDGLVGHVLEVDVDVRMLLHEPVQEVLHHLALDAVGVPHHPDVAGEGGC